MTVSGWTKTESKSVTARAKSVIATNPMKSFGVARFTNPSSP